MSSINFNQAAMVALDTLRDINMSLERTQNLISTGKKVATARDNAAVWAISTVMSTDVSSFRAITDSLNLGAATVGVARSAAEQVTGLLQEMKTLIVSAQEDNVDRTKIQTDVAALRDQIEGIVEAAQFNGLNLLQGGGSVELLSSLNRTDSGVDVDSIQVNRVNLEIGRGTFGNGGALTKGTFTAGGTAAGGTDTVVFSAATIAEGDSFRLTIDTGSAASTDYEYVAREGDTTNDVVQGLKDALFGVEGLEVTIGTSTNPSQTDVTIGVKNTSGTALDAATTFTQVAKGTATGSTGGLADLSLIDVSTDAGATSALTKIEGLMQKAIDASASFGSAQNRVDIQNDFIQSLIDSMESGISALTDANLEEASARLQSLQVQQQLNIQALTIANAAPQAILALFR